MGLSGGRFCSMGGGAPLTSEDGAQFQHLVLDKEGHHFGEADLFFLAVGETGAEGSGCGAPFASPSMVIVGTLMTGLCASRFSKSAYFASPSARPSRHR